MSTRKEETTGDFETPSDFLRSTDWEFIKRKLQNDSEIYRLLFLVRCLSGDGEGANSSRLRELMSSYRRDRLEKMGLQDYIV